MQPHQRSRQGRDEVVKQLLADEGEHQQVWSNWAKQPSGGPSGRRVLLLRLLHEAVDPFKHTIDQLTDLSCLQREYGQAEQTAVELAAVVEAVRLDLTPLIRQTRARLDVAVPAGLTLSFSEKNLHSVVYNLPATRSSTTTPTERPKCASATEWRRTSTCWRCRTTGWG